MEKISKNFFYYWLFPNTVTCQLFIFIILMSVRNAFSPCMHHLLRVSSHSLSGYDDLQTKTRY